MADGTYEEIKALLYRSGVGAAIAAVETLDNDSRQTLIDSFEGIFVAKARTFEARPKKSKEPPTEENVRLVQESLKFSQYIAHAKGKTADPLLGTYISDMSLLLTVNGIEPEKLPAEAISTPRAQKRAEEAHNTFLERRRKLCALKAGGKPGI